jgi:hypothetical protein
LESSTVGVVLSSPWQQQVRKRPRARPSR